MNNNNLLDFSRTQIRNLVRQSVALAPEQRRGGPLHRLLTPNNMLTFDYANTPKPVIECEFSKLFKTYKIYKISINKYILQSSIIEFPHSASYGLFAFNGKEFLYLSKSTLHNLQNICINDLNEEQILDVVTLSRFFVEVFLNISNFKHVLVFQASDLETMYLFNFLHDDFKYTLNIEQFNICKNSIVPPEMHSGTNGKSIRFTTVSGPNLDRQNLGIEEFSIAPNYHIAIKKRNTLSTNIFSSKPNVKI